jgi:hypothetical protein
MKTCVVAVVLLLANLAIAFGAVYAYAKLVDPGHPRAFYAALAPRIASWTAPIGGAALFFLLGALDARKRSEHDAAEHIVLTFGVYALVDVGLSALEGRGAVMNPHLAMSLFAALAGGVAGIVTMTRARIPPARLEMCGPPVP